MRTPEQFAESWVNLLNEANRQKAAPIDDEDYKEGLSKFFKEAMLEAYHAGLTRAAEIVCTVEIAQSSGYGIWYAQSLDKVPLSMAILKERDSKTNL